MDREPKEGFNQEYSIGEFSDSSEYRTKLFLTY